MRHPHLCNMTLSWAVHRHFIVTALTCLLYMYIQNITLLTFLCCFHAEGVCLIKSDVKLHVKKLLGGGKWWGHLLKVSILASESELTCDILYAHISCIITRTGLSCELLSSSSSWHAGIYQGVWIGVFTNCCVVALLTVRMDSCHFADHCNSISSCHPKSLWRHDLVRGQ